jgi:hypothetical protein
MKTNILDQLFIFYLWKYALPDTYPGAAPVLNFRNFCSRSRTCADSLQLTQNAPTIMFVSASYFVV